MTRLAMDPTTSTVTMHATSSVHPIDVVTRPTGWIEIDDISADAPRLVAARIEVAVRDLRSGNPLIDRELRRRLDARRHPAIVGELTEVLRARRDGTHALEGEITFVGETVAVEGEVTVTRVDDRVVITGEGTFDVRWWGLDPPRVLTLKVHPEVDVSIHCEFPLE